MTNILRAAKNYWKISKAIDASDSVTPILVLQDGFGHLNYCGRYNEDIKRRVSSEDAEFIDKHYYVQGHILIPHNIHTDETGRATKISTQYCSKIRDSKIERCFNEERFEGFAFFLGRSNVYAGFQEIFYGLHKIVNIGENRKIEELGGKFMPQVCEWYANFFKEQNRGLSWVLRRSMGISS